MVNAGKELHDLYRKGMSTQKVKAKSIIPNLESFRDVNSGNIDSLITPHGMGEISGYRLKVDPDDPSQGVFFTDSDNHELRVTIIGQNRPSLLSFMIPADLPKGRYTLSVRNDKGKGTLANKLIVE